MVYGPLPGIFTESGYPAKEEDLYSDVMTYLEEEMRPEAIVRNVGSFSQFLEVVAGEAGKQINYTRLSRSIGVVDTAIWQALFLLTAFIIPFSHCALGEQACENEQ